MLAAIVGLLLILTIAIGFLGLIAAPQLRSGKRILAPGGERVVATAAAAPVAAGRGTLRGLLASWRASIATAHWFQRIWHPVSEAIHGALDRLEDRDTPAKGDDSRPAVVGVADLTTRMGHSQPRGHTRSATAAGGRVHPASAWLGKTGEIPLRDISVPSDPLPSDNGDRPFAERLAESEVTRPMAPVPGVVPASAGSRSNPRSPLPSTGGISTPGLAASASPKKTDAKKSVVQTQPVAAKVGAEAPSGRTAGLAVSGGAVSGGGRAAGAEAPSARAGGRTPGTDTTSARAGVRAPGGEAPGEGRVAGGRVPEADAPSARVGGRAPSPEAPAARGTTPGSAATAAPGAAASAAGKGPRRDRFDVAAIIGNRGRLREAARIAVERLDSKSETTITGSPVAPMPVLPASVTPPASPASVVPSASVAPSDETVMIQPVKAPEVKVPEAKAAEPNVPVDKAPAAKKNEARPAAASVPSSDETVMIEPVRAPIAAADEVVRFAPIKEPVARSGEAAAPKAQVASSDETVKIAPVREPVAKAEPAVAPSDATVLIPPVVEPKAAAEKAAAEKAAAGETLVMEPVAAEEVPLVAQTVVMEPVGAGEPGGAGSAPEPATGSAPGPATQSATGFAAGSAVSAHAETEVIDAIEEPVATGGQPGAASRNGRSRGKKTRGGKQRNGR